MGIETKDDMQLGADIFSPDHEPFVIFRDGRFVTDKYVFGKMFVTIVIRAEVDR